MSGNENHDTSLPEEVRNLIVRKLEVRRREQLQLRAASHEFAHSKMRDEVAAEISKRRFGRALISIPLATFNEQIETATAITRSWPGIVWECVTSVLNKAKVTWCDADELHAIVDDLAWAEEQQPFTYTYIAPAQFMEMFYREISRYGILPGHFKTELSRQLKFTGAAAECGILNTARWARQEITIAIEEFTIVQKVNRVNPDDATTVDNDTLPCEAASGLTPVSTGSNKWGIFRNMEKLAFDELSIVFVGDKTESGLASNNMLEVSARNQARRMSLGEFDLVDRRSGSLNGQAAMLLAMAKKNYPPLSPQNALKVTRLRKVMRKNFGISGNPFDPPHKSTGWIPRFQINDIRGLADKRAQAKAELWTISLEQPNVSSAASITVSNSGEPSEDEENDASAEWLKSNDPDYRG